MSNTENGFSGSCLCEAVTYETTAMPMMSVNCYCVDCRKVSGSSHSTHAVMMGDAVEIKGDVKVYDRPSDHGAVISRAFCETCGSGVYNLNSNMPAMIFLRASTLDDMEILAPSMNVYASRAASWVALDPKLPTHAEMPEAGAEKTIAENSRK
ncbi:MAG: aldehyde-activating protein [Robiginitomaculum sp.]|nr:MAG: aldehyde-activating protein [Robiginitomaculum sp.]